MIGHGRPWLKLRKRGGKGIGEAGVTLMVVCDEHDGEDVDCEEMICSAENVVIIIAYTGRRDSHANPS